jgi:DNA-binding response OmpR family regulator
MKRRILLVDDELAILLTLKAILEIHGFDVETAASAREAKSKLRNGLYHMVMTDMRMESERAGLEVVQAAKQAECQPAIAMLTAFPLTGDEWRDQGADEMLVKPMNTRDLVLQIEALLVSHEDKKHKAEADAARRELTAGLRTTAGLQTEETAARAAAGSKAVVKRKLAAAK